MAPTSTATRTVANTALVTLTATPTATPTATTAVAQQFCTTCPGRSRFPTPTPPAQPHLRRPVGADDRRSQRSLSIAHTWVGDLRPADARRHGQEHHPARRPGPAGDLTGCELDNIDAVFDDVASTGREQLRVARRWRSRSTAASLRTGAQHLQRRQPQRHLASQHRRPGEEDVGSLLGRCLVPNFRTRWCETSPAATARPNASWSSTRRSSCRSVTPIRTAMPRCGTSPRGAATAWIRGRQRLAAVWSRDGHARPQRISCETQDCPDTNFDYFITVTDSAGTRACAAPPRS